MSLKARLLLAAAYVLTVVAIGLEVPLALAVSKEKIRLEEQRVLAYASLLAARINDEVPRASVDPNVPDPVRAGISRLVDVTAERTNIRYVVVDDQGRVIADSARQAAVGEVYDTPARPEFAKVFSQFGGDIYVAERHSDTLDEDLLIVAVPVVHFRAVVGAVRASEPLGAVQASVHRTWLGFGVAGVVAILVGMAATWLLANTLVRPVRRLEEAAVKLGSGDLDARAEPGGPAEFATLASSFNQMAGALAANISAQKEFLANASHQLRTPLTGLRLRLEAIQQEGGFAAEQAKKAEGEVDRLAALVADLLELAKAASAESTGTPVDLARCGRDAVSRWAGTAEAQRKRLVMADAGTASVWADPADLNHVLDNLLENAIRYTPSGADISVSTGVRGRSSFVSVADTGPGVPDPERDRIFERFYRGATGKQAGPGTGLGLAIVRELVSRWGGEVRLVQGPGARFEAEFPQHDGRRTASEPMAREPTDS
jgi:signal transduction histidine kinase